MPARQVLKLERAWLDTNFEVREAFKQLAQTYARFRAREVGA